MSAAPTVIPPGTRVNGSIDCPGDLIIEGEHDGVVQIGGTLTVAAGAVCRADVRARAADIHGDVIGTMVCTERVLVNAHARVVGDIRAPDVSVDADAELDGTVDLLPPDPESIPLVRAAGEHRGAALVRPAPPPRTRLPMPPASETP